MQHPLPYSAKIWGELGMAALAAAETGARRGIETLRPKRKQTYGAARHPGHDTPMWNVLATQLKERLRPYGSKVRLARHLGISPQRITDYLTGRSRLPDAEITLRLTHWLCETAEGRDPSLLMPTPKPGRPRKA
jgi:transcriptional regulator with XRE-family HTH domain